MKQKTQLLQNLEWLENEKKKDEESIKNEKQKFINEIKKWDKKDIFPEKKKLSFFDKLKRMFGK